MTQAAGGTAELPTFTVRSRGIPIGETRLDRADVSMGVAFGKFSPFPAYASVKSLLREFSKLTIARMDRRQNVALDDPRWKAYFERAKGLQLDLVDDSGALVPTSHIGIADFSVEFGEVEVEAFMEDRDFLDSRYNAGGRRVR